MGDLQDELRNKIIKEESKNERTKFMEEKKVIQFYKNNVLNPDLLSSMAKDWADEFYPFPGHKSDKRNLTSAQIRKFYGEVLSIEEKLKAQKNFELVKPQILMLKSKAAYAANPNNQKIPNSFKKWLFDMVDSIKNENDFKAFKLTFEAIVGYFYGKGAK